MTSVTSAIEKEGIVNWHIEQTAAFAVANIDSLLSRTEEQGMRYLQYYSRRLTPEKMDEVTVYDYSMGVLDDTSETGTFMHTYTEAIRRGWFEPEPAAGRNDLWQMIEAFHIWESEHPFRTVLTEGTFFGVGYAGTADWVAEVDGVMTLGDDKTSRFVHESHEAQLAALGACHTWAKEVPEGTPGAVYYKIVPSVAKHHGGQVDSWWVEEPVPDFSQYAVFQMRPDDYDRNGNFIPAFAKMHVIDYGLIEAGYDLFLGALAARHAQKKRKDVLKQLEKENA